MTEKRFTFHHDVDAVDYIEDESNGFCLICDELLCSLLNELNDENKELKDTLLSVLNQLYSSESSLIYEYSTDISNDKKELAEHFKEKYSKYGWEE